MTQPIIKINSKERGFTIVELLVVIVVIGILATITIVSYTGITQKANSTKALSNAQSVQNVAEVYAAENNVYPATAAAFAAYSGVSRLPASITVVPGSTGTAGAFTTPTPATLWGTTINPNNFDSTVTWSCLTSCTNTLGGRITYYDFTAAAQASEVIYVGQANSTSDFVAPAS